MEKQSAPQDSVACRCTFCNNNLKPSFSVSVSHFASVRGDLQAFVYAPRPFSLFEVWNLIGSLQHLDSFLFQTFCYRFTAVLGVIVLLNDPLSSHLSKEYYSRRLLVSSYTTLQT